MGWHGRTKGCRGSREGILVHDAFRLRCLCVRPKSMLGSDSAQSSLQSPYTPLHPYSATSLFHPVFQCWPVLGLYPDHAQSVSIVLLFCPHPATRRLSRVVVNFKHSARGGGHKHMAGLRLVHAHLHRAVFISIQATKTQGHLKPSPHIWQQGAD